MQINNIYSKMCGITISGIMKEIEIVNSLLFLVVLCSCGVTCEESTVTTEHPLWNYTSLFDRALSAYRKIMQNHTDRRIRLDDFKIPFQTKLTKIPTGYVEMYNGTMFDLYHLVRTGPVVLQNLDYRVLATAMFKLSDFYITYKLYKMQIGNENFSDYFAAQSRKNYIRITWNVTIWPKAAVNVTKVVLQEATDRAFIMAKMGLYVYMEREVGDAMLNRFMECEKHKVENTIKKHYVDAIKEAGIESLVYYART